MSFGSSYFENKVVRNDLLYRGKGFDGGKEWDWRGVGGLEGFFCFLFGGLILEDLAFEVDLGLCFLVVDFKCFFLVLDFVVEMLLRLLMIVLVLLLGIFVSLVLSVSLTLVSLSLEKLSIY
jgi:hypothetical protein